MSLISDTDVHAFSALANPQKARLADLCTDFKEGDLARRMGGSTHVSEDDERSEASTADEPPPPVEQRYDRGNDSPQRTPPPTPPRSPSPDSAHPLEAASQAGAPDERAGFGDTRPASQVGLSRPASEVSGVASITRRGRPASGVSERPTPPSDDEERHTEVDSAVNSQIEPRRGASDAGSRQPRSSADFSANRFGDYIAQARPPVPAMATRPDSRRREDATVIHEKQNVLMDISRLKLQGVHFSKEWSLDDSLDDMQYEIRRHMLHMEELNNVKMMRDGMRMICTGIEMLNGRMQILELNGWASDVCGDMSQYDPALSKLYRKYWRKSQSSSPEMEIATSVLMSMGMYHFKRKLSSRMFPGQTTRPASTPAAPTTRRRAPSPTPSDTSSEDLPP